MAINYKAMENFDQKFSYERAKKKAKNLRSFYFNLLSYCIVIPILIIVNVTLTPEFQWFWFSMLGWGVGVLAHAMEVFNFNPILGKNWEEKKLQQFIEEERQKQHKQNQF